MEHVACLTQVLRLIANEYVAHAQTNKQQGVVSETLDKTKDSSPTTTST